MNDPTTIRRLYGRRQGHKLRAGQAALVEEMLAVVSVPETGGLDARTLFGDDRLLEVEIGFGAGEHLAGQAAARPGTGFIGCEPFLNGVVGALNHIRDDKLGNVRLHMGDALDVLRRLPDASLAFVYLLHPDPWPKNRHAKRRMMNDGPLDLIATKLKPGGEFRMATDHPVYLTHALMVMQRHRHQYDWLIEGPSDWLAYPGGWPETRYAAKARREGRRPHQFRYRRIGSSLSNRPSSSSRNTDPSGP